MLRNDATATFMFKCTYIQKKMNIKCFFYIRSDETEMLKYGRVYFFFFIFALYNNNNNHMYLWKHLVKH